MEKLLQRRTIQIKSTYFLGTGGVSQLCGAEKTNSAENCAFSGTAHCGQETQEEKVHRTC